PDAGDAKPGVGVLGHAVRRRLESSAERRGLGAVGAYEQSPAVTGERGELRAQRGELVMVAAHVVDDADGGMVADERAVRFARLRDRGTSGRAGHEAAARAFADEVGAAQHGRLDAALTQEPAEHTDDRALAAGTRDRHAGRGGVDHLGEELRPRYTFEA